jgi:rubrerythrin
MKREELMHNYDVQHYPEVLKEIREQVLWAEENRHTFKDDTGQASEVDLSYARDLATLGYICEGDIAAFRAGMKKCAEIKLSLFERFAAGEPIDRSTMSIHAFRKVYDALAAGAFDLARRLSAHVGSRKDIDEKQAIPMIRYFGYMLKAFVDEQPEEVCRTAIAEAIPMIGKNFQGYAMVLTALLDRNLDAAHKGFAELIRGHKRDVKSKYSSLNGTEEEMISVWGIGLANLCRSRGFNVMVDDPVIPGELLVRKG